MCEPTTIMLITTAVAGGIAAKGQYEQGQMAKQVGRNNEIMAEYAAQDALKRGEEDAQAARRKGDQVLGAQRAAQAASGLDLGVGTAAELQDQTSFFSQVDQRTLRGNAAREAWAARAGGAQARAQGNASASQANLSATGTLLGSASQVASKWYTPSSVGYTPQFGDDGNMPSGLDMRTVRSRNGNW